MDLQLRVQNMLTPIFSAAPPHANRVILLGLSGGVDSIVLLNLLHQWSFRNFWSLRALHVHHGISPHANSWAAFCADSCEKLNVPLQVERVNIAPLRAMGVEAAARQLRYAALLGQPADYIVLAHHQDDQVETLLLQLLRGAGVRGAAAMPMVKQAMAKQVTHETAHTKTLLRPLLDVPRSELVKYAQAHGLQWIEDESNADDRYPRNFLRHRVLPVLEARFPAYRATLSRSARNFAEASELLDELALQDWALQDINQHAQVNKATLKVSRLSELNAARGKNLLRYFFASLNAPTPDSTQLEEMLHQLCYARNDATVCVNFGEWQVRRYQGMVYVAPICSVLTKEFRENFCVAWRGESVLPLPNLGGTLHFQSVSGQGISLQKLQLKPVTVRLRRGAERIRPHAQRPTRILKNLLQEHAIPPWQRDRLPLLFCGEDLVWVAGVATAENYWSQPGETGMQLVWNLGNL
ncbi:MAG: tRNA lysidine(34) synthetase TilS [Candidatus Nitrotoga sp.]